MTLVESSPRQPAVWMSQRLALLGWSLYLPGYDLRGPLASSGVAARGDWAGPAPEAADAAQVLGRKGLLSKSVVTRLALCAVHRALGLPSGIRRKADVDPGVAVMAASGLGNTDSVAGLAQQLQSGGPATVSVLDAPNASCNVVATSVASRFGLGGPCLMFTSGAHSGAHALDAARTVLAAGRASTVVLVGAESATGAGAQLWGESGRAVALRSVGACVVLAAQSPADHRGGPVVEFAGELSPGAQLSLASGAAELSPDQLWGDGYGATLPALLALAGHLAVDEGRGQVTLLADGSSRFAVMGTP
jgi:3-oxoacyl-[acyl-carrier-protein] synthase II